MSSIAPENKSQLVNLENPAENIDVKIAAENKSYGLEEAKQHMVDAINKLNQRVGQESYSIRGIQTRVDAYGIETINFNIDYLGQSLTNVEACLSANPNGLRRGVNLDSENIAILLAAATIQLKAGLSKDGYLVKNGR